MDDFEKSFATPEEAEEYVQLEKMHDHRKDNYRIVNITEYM